MTIHIYLVEDHPIFQYMLSAFFRRLPGFIVCGVASSGQEALTQIPQINPDIVLLDISLPDITGIEVVQKLHLSYPELPMLMLSGHNEEMYVRQALQAGARGFIVKGHPEQMEPAIQAVLNGEIYLSPQLRNQKTY